MWNYLSRFNLIKVIACGTPCVAFNIGGIPDMIEHQKNGYLALPFEIEDLARGIAWVLEDSPGKNPDKTRQTRKAACILQ